MKPTFRPALTLLLGTALPFALASCDYNYSPGKNPQYQNGFSNAPNWRNEDVNRDSVNYKQRAPAPSGEGSAIAIKNGTVDEQRASAPGGASAAATQTASGQLEMPQGEERPSESGE